MNQILVSEKLIITPEFKKKEKLYKFNFFLSVFLACTLFSCYIYAEYDRNKSEQVSQEILIGLQESQEPGEEEDTPVNDNTIISVENDVLFVTLLDDNPTEEPSEYSITKLLNEQREEIQNKSKNKNTTIVESVAEDGTKYYTESILRIDSLGIEYPVLSDTSDELLKISLNKLWGPNPNEVGNYVIIGHNYKSGKMFGKLKGISLGDTFTLEDLSGRIVTYKVYDRYVVEPTDVACTSQLTGGRKEVTLITCQNSGKQRLIVKAMEV